MPTEDDIRAALATVKYPGFSRDIVSFGLIQSVKMEGRNAIVDITLATRDANIPRQIHEQATLALRAVPGIGEIKLNFDIKDAPAAPAQGGPAAITSSIPGVKHVVAVASGK